MNTTTLTLQKHQNAKADDHDVLGTLALAWPCSVCSSRWSPPATNSDSRKPLMLYLTGILTIAPWFTSPL